MKKFKLERALLLLQQMNRCVCIVAFVMLGCGKKAAPVSTVPPKGFSTAQEPSVSTQIVANVAEAPHYEGSYVLFTGYMWNRLDLNQYLTIITRFMFTDHNELNTPRMDGNGSIKSVLAI
jgi:hypothetical protein